MICCPPVRKASYVMRNLSTKYDFCQSFRHIFSLPAYPKPTNCHEVLPMNYFPIKAMQTDHPDEGRLRISVLSAIRNTPIENATIDILYTGEPSSVIDELKTDANGLTPEITLPAPPLEYSMEPSEYQPYAEYTFHIEEIGRAHV